MDSKILLGKILQRFEDVGIAQVKGYKKFKRIRETNSSVIVLRENKREAIIPFTKMLDGIRLYQKNPAYYDLGPTQLRIAQIKFVSSPIFALLHLIPLEAYCNTKKINKN